MHPKTNYYEGECDSFVRPCVLFIVSLSLLTAQKHYKCTIGNQLSFVESFKSAVEKSFKANLEQCLVTGKPQRSRMPFFNVEPSIFLLPIFFATQIIGRAKKLVVYLLLSGDI